MTMMMIMMMMRLMAAMKIMMTMMIMMKNVLFSCCGKNARTRVSRNTPTVHKTRAHKKHKTGWCNVNHHLRYLGTPESKHQLAHTGPHAHVTHGQGRGLGRHPCILQLVAARVNMGSCCAGALACRSRVTLRKQSGKAPASPM